MPTSRNVMPLGGEAPRRMVAGHQELTFGTGVST